MAFASHASFSSNDRQSSVSLGNSVRCLATRSFGSHSVLGHAQDTRSPRPATRLTPGWRAFDRNQPARREGQPGAPVAAPAATIGAPVSRYVLKPDTMNTVPPMNSRSPSLGNGTATDNPAIMANVEDVEVVVAHRERATLRVGDVFLKIDADQTRTDVEVEAMAMAPVPTPEILWRKPHKVRERSVQEHRGAFV